MKWTLWFFGASVLLTLAVSIPATYTALSVWHNDGSPYGWVLAVFALVVFEVGAVGAKLATLAIPEWRGRLTALTIGLLTVTTGANYAHGYDLSQAAQAQPTLAGILHNPYGAVVATLATAALFPALLFVFLSAFVSRCEAFANYRDALAIAREQFALLHEKYEDTREQLANAREVSVGDVRSAMRVLVAAGAPEATMRTWIENGRLRLAETAEVIEQ